MRLVDCDSAAEYLVERGLAERGERLDVSQLAGGVSNIVLLVRRPESGREPFVLKQARRQLRVPQPWFCAVERMLREIDVLRAIEPLVAELAARDAASSSAATPSSEPPRGDAVAVHVPRILHEDRENFALAMTAAPTPHATWKERLLAGDLDRGFAAATGRLLGWLHARTWNDASLAAAFEDRTFFDDLRLDPYYRQIARVHPDLAPVVERLIDDVWTHRRALVHGDFSPKNLLVWDRDLMLIDFEVGHFGDPAFDLGFFLTHLTLKSFHHGGRSERGLAMVDLIREFWRAYETELAAAVADDELAALKRRAVVNLAGCLLARVDGKSRVDYAVDAAPVRALARRLLVSPPSEWSAVYDELHRAYEHP